MKPPEPASRHYAIQSHETYGFFAGVDRENRPVLMGLLCPNLIAIRFDDDGSIRQVERRQLEFLRHNSVIVDGVPLEGIRPIYDTRDERIWTRLKEWQSEVQFRQMRINVRRFFLEDVDVGIEDFPDDWDEQVNDPDAAEDEKQEALDSMQTWTAEGQFVLFWGNDYWMDANGDVVSS